LDAPQPILAADLLERRNRHLGQLLLSDRATSYLSILIEMLAFRRHYVSEPLHDDLYQALCASSAEGTLYSADQFNQDMRQLLDWNLVADRIEKERLRGYKDTRRRKFRYRILDDTVAFLLWLEARRRDDLEPNDADTRDLLSELAGTLHETTRLFNKTSAETLDYETARSIFYRLSRMLALTDHVAQTLGDFNIRLLSFAMQRYDAATARAIIAELDRFLKQFLSRIYTLRTEIAPSISRLRHTRYTARWQHCRACMEEEARATTRLVRIHLPDPAHTLASLTDFYAAEGTLEQLCDRVNASALQVWRKLYSHLRELERRSHRLEDVRARISEIAQLHDTEVPERFLRNLLAPARLVGDMHFWDENEKALPPQPRWDQRRVREEMTLDLAEKPRGEAYIPRSMEESRLHALAEWINQRGLAPLTDAEERYLSEGAFHTLTDFQRIVEFSRAGLLGRGLKLTKIGLHVAATETHTAVELDRNRLAFKELIVRKNTK
jgi:hypothetical protein